MKYSNIREEELKNKVGQDYFSDYDTTMIIGNIDFCVIPKSKDQNQKKIFGEHSLLWAEAKTGNYDIVSMFAQLILTIGKARTFDKNLPPAFLGAFDFKKIAFVPYDKVQHLFFKNDFNWNVTPSNQETKEFIEIRILIESILNSSTYCYDFGKDDKELHFFIKNNIAKATEGGRIQIDKNNFVPIYLRWLEKVKPLINFDFAEGKKQNILDSDFYLADLFVDDHDTTTAEDDTPLRNELFVVFRNSRYEIAKESLKSLFNATIDIRDKKAYEQFWKKYKRPPILEFQNYIIERRDLLVPQDIRERKGAFFTPRLWVELSQEYITKALGENWQEDYYIWDCAAGTGNLLTGLTNKYNIWASTLDQADVNVIHDRIKHGANLLDDHVFQFDFLNDEFSKLPQPLQDIINNPEKRKKLVIYINPPYAEATSYGLKSKQGVSSNNKTYEKYRNIIGSAINELFIQFFIRIYNEIPDCKLATFSKLKFINAQAFDKFRTHFKAEKLTSFVCSASTFDNVKGNFPIMFSIWNLDSKIEITILESDVILNDSNLTLCWQGGTKKFYASKKGTFIIDWLRKYFDKKSDKIGFLRIQGTDIQQNRTIFITSKPSESDFRESKVTEITKNNLIEVSIYFTLRKIIEPTWLNDRDQYLYPNEGWKKDLEFQNDCFTYTLFSNNIQSKYETNHWIPFTEHEVNSREKFESNFMTNYILGKLKQDSIGDLFGIQEQRTTPLEFSKEAMDVFNAGRELWRYYHKQPNCNVNASLYDIREYFQGRNEQGKMNNKSEDETYMKLINELREKLRLIEKKLEPKVYEYGFLK